MAKKAAMIFGVIFVLIGLLGFVNNPVLGMFAVDTAHNIVHLILGIILIVAARGAGANKALKVVGIIYFVVAILGFFMASADGMLLGLITVNGADNWLHLVFAVILFGASMGGGKKSMPMMGQQQQPMASQNSGSNMNM